MISAEYVDQNPLYVRVFEEDVESLRDGLFGRAAANVEEVCGIAAEVLYYVHCRHRKPGAVHHARDVAVERDVVEPVLAGLDFLGVFFVRVTEFLNLGVAEEAVVVERNLGVEADDSLVFGENEGIDFNHRAVLLPEEPVKAGDYRLELLLHFLFAEAEEERELPYLEGLQADVGVYEHLHDLLGSFLRDLFNVHAARNGSYYRDFSGSPVHEDGEIVLLLYIEGLREVERPDNPALRAGLFGDKGVAEHFFGGLHSLGLGDEFYASLETVNKYALAAPASVDLRLDDHMVAGNRRYRRVELRGRFYRNAVLNRDAEFLE